MQKVITINLNGNAYQIDEPGFAALVAYLDGAERQLKDNPDRVEILADLEQAIAEKANHFLGPHKTVITALEVDRIIKEMGPVNAADDRGGTGAGASAAAGGPKPRADANAPRRLYLIREGSMIAGVCNGLAAYLHIDATILRLIFIALTLLTKGGFILAYVVLAFVVPSADTSEERAAAHGEPFSAQELIDRAKENYARFKDSNSRRRYWRWEHRQWKRQWKQQWRQQRWQGKQPPWQAADTAQAGYAPPAAYGMQLLAGVMVPILSIASAAFFWLWVYAMASLLTTHEVFSQPLPDDIPLWGGVLILVFVYQAVAWPLHAARRGSYYALAGRHYGMVAAFDGLMSLGFGILVVWLAYRYVPEVREFIQTLPDVWESLRGSRI